MIAAESGTSIIRPSMSARPMRTSQSSNSGRCPPPGHAPDVENVVEGEALIVEHDVVRSGNGDDEGCSGRRQHGQQNVHVVLVGLRVIRVADVATHRQAQELGAEMILEACSDDLLAVVEIFRSDEADDGIDEQRL